MVNNSVRSSRPVSRKRQSAMTHVAILGLGEAGRLYAEGLAAMGVTVVGHDPYQLHQIDGVVRADSPREALKSATVVFSFVGARAAHSVFDDALPHLRSDAVFADCNTASPGLKAEMESAARAAGKSFLDVAIMAPVDRAGARTPLLGSGSGADAFTDFAAQFGIPFTVVPGAAGEAARRKLLRSVFMKGLAAVILESTTAAEAAGHADWMRGQILSEMTGASEAFLDRLVLGSRQHAERRAHETRDAAEFLHELGTPTWATDASTSWLDHLTSLTTTEE
nr:NAD(P)-dependent oxidoreductase [Gulosibacter faecalis]